MNLLGDDGNGVEPSAQAVAGVPISDDAVFRRLSDGGPNMVAVDLATQEKRPSSGSFKPDDDGVSVFRESILANAGLGPQHIVKSQANLVVRLPVAAVRSVALDVADDPWPSDVDDPSRPCYVAHALIVGWAGLSKNERLRRQKGLAQHPELQFVIA